MEKWGGGEERGAKNDEDEAGGSDFPASLLIQIVVVSSLPTTIRSRSLACYDEEESPILFLKSPRKELSFFSRPNEVILLDVVAE